MNTVLQMSNGHVFGLSLRDREIRLQDVMYNRAETARMTMNLGLVGHYTKQRC